MLYKQAMACCNLLDEGKLDNNMKLFIILDLVHSEWWGIHKAYEELEKYGLMSKSWTEIDAELIPLVEEEIERIDK